MKKHWITFLIILVVMILFWSGSLFLLAKNLDWHFPHLLSQIGLLGDSFGAINALFSGMAFAGVIFTILVQMEELKMNREELRKTSEAMKEQVAQMEKAARLQSLSTLINYNISVAEQFRGTMSQSQTRTKALKKIEIYEAEIKKIAEIKDEIKQ